MKGFDSLVSKNNFRNKMEAEAKRVPHFGLRKLSVGVASVLLSTTLYFGVTAHAATNVSVESSPSASQDTHTASPYSASEVKLGVAGTVDGNVNSASAVNENVNKAGNGSASSSVDSAVNNSANVNGNTFASSSAASAVNENVNNAGNASASLSANGSANKTVNSSVNLSANSSANSSSSASVNDVANDNLIATTFNTLMDHSSRIDPAMLTQNLSVLKANDKVPYQAGTAGVNNAFNRYVSRTINITLPDGKNNSITQTVHFVRKDAQGNAGTENNDGTVNYVGWTVANSPSETLGHFDVVSLPKVAGYAAVDELSSSEVNTEFH